LDGALAVDSHAMAYDGPIFSNLALLLCALSCFFRNSIIDLKLLIDIEVVAQIMFIIEHDVSVVVTDYMGT
jgi:hypothetical protein